MKITDLDKFTLEHVFRPYQTNILGDTGGKRIEHLTKDFNLETVLALFKEHPEWRDLVMDRIVRCKFKFPVYIQHPLVDFIKAWEEKIK